MRIEKSASPGPGPRQAAAAQEPTAGAFLPPGDSSGQVCHLGKVREGNINITRQNTATFPSSPSTSKGGRAGQGRKLRPIEQANDLPKVLKSVAEPELKPRLDV